MATTCSRIWMNTRTTKNAHRDGLWTVQNGGCHDSPVLGKGQGQGSGKLEPRQVVTICDHLQLFLCRESKGEITWETICIPFDRLVQGLRRNCIERGKIGIDDDLTATNCENHGSERFEWLHDRIF